MDAQAALSLNICQLVPFAGLSIITQTINLIISFYQKYRIYKPRELKNPIKKRVRNTSFFPRFINPISEIELFNKLYNTCILVELLAQIKKILRHAVWQK